MAWSTCSISPWCCQAQISTCLSKSVTNLKMDNQISNLVVAENAVHIVRGGIHMLFPSSAEVKLTSCRIIISITHFVLSLTTS